MIRVMKMARYTHTHIHTHSNVARNTTVSSKKPVQTRSANNGNCNSNNKKLISHSGGYTNPTLTPAVATAAIAARGSSSCSISGGSYDDNNSSSRRTIQRG